jgi:adenine-specific DNA-methyltransferase
MKFDKEELTRKIRDSKDLSNEDKSNLLQLLKEKKTYGLVWEDSTEDAWEMMKDNIPVLKEDETKQILHGSENPNHILIEGDNLNALTALSYTHEGKVDVIYIDPPYNTGNKDFIYNDSFVDAEDSYRHSKWLSFMEKRLKIARRLLSDKGVIFISIDDNEQAQLKILCSEIFGEQNFQGHIHWRRRHNQPNDKTKMIGLVAEHIIVYSKNAVVLKEFGVGKIPLTATFTNPDNDPRGPWASKPWKTGSDQGGSSYTIISPKGDVFQEVWMGDENTYNQLLADNRIYFPNNGHGFPRKKYYQSEREEEGQCACNWWPHDQFGHNQGANDLLTAIFGEKNKFSNPKPIELVSNLIKIANISRNNIILDFFAGSGTTLHATMQLNAEDGGHRQCILITNNENNICEEVTYERNKRVIEGYTKPNGDFVEGLKNNNLRYYKIDFKERKQSHQSNRELFHEMKDLLCIKEDIYQEQHQFGSLPLKGKERMIRYFAENGREMLMVYDTRVIPFIVKEIEKMSEKEQPLKIYIFADGAYPYTDDFATVIDKVSLVPMPYAFYRGIKDSLPDVEPKKEDNTELTDEEQKQMMAEAIEAENNEKKED